jgi:hypothetical protein
VSKSKFYAFHRPSHQATFEFSTRARPRGPLPGALAPGLTFVINFYLKCVIIFGLAGRWERFQLGATRGPGPRVPPAPGPPPRATTGTVLPARPLRPPAAAPATTPTNCRACRLLPLRTAPYDATRQQHMLQKVKAAAARSAALARAPSCPRDFPLPSCPRD